MIGELTQIPKDLYHSQVCCRASPYYGADSIAWGFQGLHYIHQNAMQKYGFCAFTVKRDIKELQGYSERKCSTALYFILVSAYQ